MARIEPKLPEFEFNKLVNRWVEWKKTNPQRINRELTYSLYNQIWNDRQRDVNACSCMDVDSDIKVTRHLEAYLKMDEPLPVESNVKIDMSGLTAAGEKLTVFGEEEDLVGELLEDNITERKIPDPVKPKRKYTRKKKTNETKGKTSIK